MEQDPADKDKRHGRSGGGEGKISVDGEENVVRGGESSGDKGGECV